MSKYPLKAWGDPAWMRQVTKTLTASRVDADIPTERQKKDRKPWYIALTQKPNLLDEVGGVSGLPAGDTILLSEHDVLALVRYLLEPQTALWVSTPTVTEPDDVEVALFVQPGMVEVTNTGDVVNGEANWSPEYFKQQTPVDVPTRKIHTLPWELPPDQSSTPPTHTNGAPTEDQ